MTTDTLFTPESQMRSSRGSTAGPGTVPDTLDPVAPRLRVKPRHDDSRAVAFRDRFQRGFTLLEVMIALLVITLGMGAVMSTTSESGWKSSHLRESTIASWVAYNEIALYRASRTWNSVSKRSGVTEMANADWEWSMEISKTDDDKLRRLDVEVTLKGEDAVKARVTGFIANI